MGGEFPTKTTKVPAYRPPWLAPAGQGAGKENKMPKHGKKYLEAAKLIEHGHYYSPEEAVALVKQTHFAEFDATVVFDRIRLRVPTSAYMPPP